MNDLIQKMLLPSGSLIASMMTGLHQMMNFTGKCFYFSKVLSIRKSQRESKQPQITSHTSTKGQQLKRVNTYLWNYVDMYRFK